MRELEQDPAGYFRRLNQAFVRWFKLSGVVLLLCLAVLVAGYGHSPLLHLPIWVRQLTATTAFLALCVFAFTGAMIIGFQVLDRRDRNR
jgi:hypothetical protein